MTTTTTTKGSTTMATLELTSHGWHAQCMRCKQLRLNTHNTFKQLAEWVDRHNAEKH